MKILLRGEGSGNLLSYAKKRLGLLDLARLKSGVDQMIKRFAVGDYLIFITSSRHGNKVEIYGSNLGLDHIVFSSNDNVLYGFNWGKNSYALRGIGGSGFMQGYNLRLERPGIDYYFCSGGKVTLKESSFIIGDQTAIYYPKNAIAQLSGGMLQLRFNKLGYDVIYNIAEINGQSVSVHGDMLGVLNEFSPTWNRLVRPELTLASAVEGGGSYPSFWRWTPRLWHPSPGNQLELEPGIYYGSPVSFYGPYERAKVRFCGLLRCRGGLTPFGYAEALSTATTKDGSKDNHNIVFFSFTPWEADKDFFLSWTGGYQKTRFFQHNYWETIPREDFAIDYGVANNSFEGMTETPTINWWSADTILPSEENGYSDTIDITCVVASNNGFVRVHVTKMIGGGPGFYVQEIPMLVNAGAYHSHSVSANGQILALFFSDIGSSVINEVVVYDFSLSFDTPISKDATDKSRIALAKRGITYGQIIPTFDNPEASDSLLTAWHGELSTPVYRTDLYDISMFGMRHPMPVTEGYDASGWQVNIDGTEAEGFLWEDDCWENNTYTEHSLVGISPKDIPEIYEIDKLILYNYDPSVGLSNVIGRGEKLAEGITSVGGGTTIKRADLYIFPWLEANTNCLVAGKNAKGPVEWSGDVKFSSTSNCWTLKEVCSEEPTVILNDSCGKSASQSFEYLLDPIVVTGSNLAEVGEIYSARGGIGPYEFSFSGGSITRDGEILSLGDCSDYAGVAMATVTATDSCGRQGELSVRLPSGQWVLKIDKGLPPDLYWIDRTIVSGSTKTVNVYTRSGTEFSNFFQYCNSGDCIPVGKENTCEGQYVCSALDICGQTPSLPVYTEGLGPFDSATLHYSGDYPCIAELNDGYCYSRYGWNCYGEDSRYGRVYEWECP